MKTAGRFDKAKGDRWTEDDIAKLRGMAQKYPVERIAKELERSVTSTRVRARVLRLSLRMSDDRKSLENREHAGVRHAP